MSYWFPIITAPRCTGWATVYNFAPNNWQEGKRIDRHLNVSWTNGTSWQSALLAMVPYGRARRVYRDELSGVVPEGCTPFLSLTDEPIKQCDMIPENYPMPHTSYPNWRGSLGLTSEAGVEVCYQGEIGPFPSPGSLLTFGHLLQIDVNVENFLLFLNLESRPEVRSSKVEIRSAATPNMLKAEFEVRSNTVTSIPLDEMDFDNSDLPLIICKGMSAIPLYFSRTKDGSFLSLEHTHPPASFVAYGKRLDAHKHLKKIWFSKAAAT